jgi:ATP-dependent Lon protease
MEVIRLSGYTTEEKLHIARRHLIPKQLGEHGLAKENVAFTDAALRRIVRDYAREAGLRNLEREIAAVCRKTAVRVASGETVSQTVTADNLPDLLGAPRHIAEELLRRDRVGVATGLAWTAAGGELLFVEVVIVPGKGELKLTGQLGDVMKESAHAALTYTRAVASALDADFFTRHDLHIHVPAGSIPKDGPSAGITIGTALVSAVEKKAVNRRVAMTGEITLRGDVMPIGGLKEKILAARAAGIRTVLLPKLNQRDLAEIPPELSKGLTFHLVEHMDEVLELALLR